VSAPQNQGERRQVEIRFIDPDPRNPRGKISRTDPAVVEMAASLREHGQIQPMVARPHPTEPGRFMTVVGHRRHVALELASFSTADVIVRDLTDEEAFEVMVVENDHRQELPPLGEARAFALIAETTGSTDACALRVSKPAAYVRSRLTLLDLDPAVQQRLAARKLPIEHALSVAKLPRALHVEAANAIECDDGSVLSLREATLLLRNKFTLRLDTAPFDRGDFDLYPDAGPCTTCPKRSGGQGELFAEVATPDLCLDSACFAEKRDRAWTARAAAHEKKSLPVYEGKQAKQALADSSYLDLDSACSRDARGRPWREVLGKAVTKLPTVLARDPEKGVHELVPRADVAGAKLGDPAREAFDAEQKARQEQLDRELSELQREQRREAMVRSAIERVVLLIEGGDPLPNALAQELAVAAVEVTWPETLKSVAARLNVPKGDAAEELVNVARQLPAPQALALLIELILTRVATRGDDPLGAGSTLARVLAACGPQKGSGGPRPKKAKGEKKAPAKGVKKGKVKA
jgi:ParB/RepB/Spo0J family partition protein